MKKPFAVFLVAMVHASISVSTLAQDFPSKPIQVVTAEAGGGIDILTRLVGKTVGASLGQPMVVINRVGVDGELSVIKAAPDGHTLLVRGATMWTLPFLRANVPYDPQRDFAPISVIAAFPSVLVVTPSLPFKTPQDLVAYARSHPGELNYASSVPGSAAHLAAELFTAMSGTKIAKINYKGSAPAMADVMAGRVQLMFPSAGASRANVASGKLRALGVTSAQPSALFPDLPTVASAVPGYDADSMTAVFGPLKTPPAIINRLSTEFVKAVNAPEVRDAMLNAGIEPVGTTPQDMAVKLKAEIVKWGKLIKEAGIREDE